jgi:peptidyl-dipeptidase A
MTGTHPDVSMTRRDRCLRPPRLRRALVGALSFAALATATASMAETAEEFVARVNKELADFLLEYNAAGWTQVTYINADTELLAAKATERALGLVSSKVEESKKFEGQAMSPASKRSIELLKLQVAAPAANDPAKRAELAKLLAGMETKYGSAKYCPQGPASCKDQTQLKELMEKSRNYDELLGAW